MFTKLGAAHPMFARLDAAMQLRSISGVTLPQLAWVAEVDRKRETVTLVHGSKVEGRENFFIEGGMVLLRAVTLAKPSACSDAAAY